MNDHQNTVAGGGIGLTGFIVTWYLAHVQAINGVLQTMLLTISILAVLIGWLRKGTSRYD